MSEYKNVKKLIYEVLDDDLFTCIDERIKEKFNLTDNNEITISSKKAKVYYQHLFSSKKSKHSRQFNIEIKYNNDLTEEQICKFLEKVKNFLNNKERKFVLLIDEASDYYRNLSFNVLQKIEVSLRCLIYKVFIKHKGTLWDKDILPIIENLNIRNLDQLKNNPDFMLQELEFGTLINLFFDDLITFDYSSLPSDEELKNKSNDDLIEIIKSTKPISINDLYFSKYNISWNDFKQMQNYRNKVMHFKEIKYNEYSQFHSASKRQMNILDTIVKDLGGNSLESVYKAIASIDFSGFSEVIKNATSSLVSAMKSLPDIFKNL